MLTSESSEPGEAREIRPLLNYGGEATPVHPDDVPKAPGIYEQLPRTSLVLYVYRVPGSQDLFLTQHKIPNDHPTSTDVNGSTYYIRYDKWPTFAVKYPSSNSGSTKHENDGVKKLEWRNLTQRSLSDRGLIGPRGSKMSLVAVNMSANDIREIASLVDPKIPGKIYRANSRSQIPSVDYVNAENPFFIDVFPKAYEAFGVDMAYWHGKAFTRRVFRADSPKQQHVFASPWGGQVTIERHAYGGKPTFKAYHRIENRGALDGILTSELRPNFSPHRRTYGGSVASASNRQSMSFTHQNSFDSTTSISSQNKSSNHRERLNRLRHRSEIISGSAKERLNVMLNSHNKSFDGFDYNNFESSFHLAREPLGGGTGDEAKLAKLVIYPEGQDFIDLVVAANMLVFHSIYEKAMPWLHGT